MPKDLSGSGGGQRGPLSKRRCSLEARGDRGTMNSSSQQLNHEFLRRKVQIAVQQKFDGKMSINNHVE